MSERLVPIENSTCLDDLRIERVLGWHVLGISGNRCTDPTYSGWFLRGRSARDVEELEQWLTKLTRCQTLV